MLLSTYAAGNAVLQSVADLGPIVEVLSQVPLVVGMSWVLIKQQDKHNRIVQDIMVAMSERLQRKDDFYGGLLQDILDICIKKG